MTAMPDYALLSLAGYPRTPANAGPPPQGWIQYAIATDPASDFDAVAFYNPSTHEVVISYAGTDQIPDLHNLSLSEIERVKEDWLLTNLPAAIGAR
jgi:hypothetical protein